MNTYEFYSILLQVLFGIIAIASLLIYFRQLRVMSNQITAMQESSKSQGGLSLVLFLQSADVRNARSEVRKVLSKKPLSKWTDKDKQNASLVVSNYDVAGALIRSGIAPIDLIITNWGPSICHCYSVLEPFIDEHRKLPGGTNNYWSNFHWLYEQIVSKK